MKNHQAHNNKVKMTVSKDIQMCDKKKSVGKAASVEDGPTEFTEIVGSQGAWQIRILIFTIFTGAPVAWNHMAISFFSLPLDYWCSSHEGLNASEGIWLRPSLSNRSSDDSDTLKQCEMVSINASAYGQNLMNTTVPCKDWEYDSDRTTIVRQWNLVCDKEWMVSMSQSVYMAGFLAAVLLSGQLADSYGRRPIILFNVLILILAGIMTAFSTSFIMFTILRFFVAMGQSGLSLTLFVLGIEVVGSSHRATYALLQNIGWHFGYCTLPWMAYYIKTWNYLQLAITIPCLSFISLYWVIPESPRWLLTNGKLDKAIKVLEKAAKTNGYEVEDLERRTKALCSVIEKEEELKNSATVLDLLRTPNLRNKTLNLYFAWIVIAFVYYGLSLNTGELGGDFFLNFFLSGLVEIPATLFCIVFMKRFGRRYPFMFTLVFGGLACIGCIFIPETMQSLKIAIAMTGKLLVSSSFSMVYIYSAEIYPTVARNVGVGSSSTMARFGSILAPFMKELGKLTNSGVPMGIFGVLSIASGMLVWFLPETRNFPVPETLEQAEEFGKKKPLAQQVN